MIKIIDYIKSFWIIIGAIVCFELCEVAVPEDAYAGANSLIEQETRTHYSGLVDFVVKLVKNMYNCLWSDRIYNPGQLKNTCIPRIITSDSSYEKDCDGSGDNKGAYAIAIIGEVMFFMILVTMIVSFWIPVIGPPIFMIMIIRLMPDIVSCLGSYILAPHEYINGLLNRVNCIKSGDKIVNNVPNALTMDDVPFFYNCADQRTDKNKIAQSIQRGDISTLDAVDGYGNMNDPSVPYCQGGNEKYALNNLRGQYGGIPVSEVKPGSIIVGIIGKNNFLGFGMLFGARERCLISKDRLYHMDLTRIRKGELHGSIFKTEPVPFYRLHNGKIQLCAARISLFFGPMIAGCTYIAPPIEAIPIDPGFTAQTRCSYFLSTRTDLNSLGARMNANAFPDNYSPIGLFLQSDFHMISTMVGCLQDLLIKVVVGVEGHQKESLLYLTQNALKNIIYVVLILYISILGIKIMSNPNPPQMGEVVMYVLKFGVVFGMSGIGGQNIWYSHSSNNQSSPGLYVMLLDAMNGLSSIILESTNNLTPVNMCYQASDDGRNILSQRSIPATPISQGTRGALQATQTILPRDQNQLILSVWDFVDCKMASYINLNSCKYSVSGIISMWLISVSIWLPSSIFLAILIITFSIVLFLTMFRFVHITIISMFAITILVLLSPIFACFLLFDFTKDTFNTWFKMILGYILYPALTFTFLGLMITTFDAVFYGQPIKPECITSSTSCSISDICGTSQSDNNSIYCTITRSVSQNRDQPVSATMCNVSTSIIIEAISNEYHYLFYKIKVIKTELYVQFFIGFAKMTLFIALFYYMTNSTLKFFETLLSIAGVSDMAPDLVGKGLSAAKSAASAAASYVTGGASKVAESAFNAVRDNAGGNQAAPDGGGGNQAAPDGGGGNQP